MTTQAENTQLGQGELAGVGGWLLILIVKLWVSAAVRIAVGISAGATALGMANASGSVTATEMGLSATNLLAGVLAGVAGYLLTFKNPKGPLLAKIFLILDAGYYLLLLLSALGGTAPAADGPLPAWYRPTGYLLACVIWFAYLLRSRRVANTYHERPASHGENALRPSTGAQSWEEFSPGNGPAQELKS